jgi:subtilisin family serine protease
VRVADVQAEATQKSPVWNLDLIDQRTTTRSGTYTPLSAASSVHAYVIDTGIDWTHPDFGGRVTSGFSYNGGTAMDCDGHGTHVAGTIGGARYGVAKGVQLVAVRVLNCDGEGFLSDVIKGVNWVTRYAKKPAVANMSLGGDASAALDTAVRRSIASGVTYAVAAGNEGRDACRVSPARVSTALTAGAVGGTFARPAFSNYGKCLDLFAPGIGVWSDAPGSKITQMSGTSMASPHVAGAAAMLLASAPTMKPAQVASRLLAYTTRNKVRNAGKNSPNRELFTIKPPAAVRITTASLHTGTMGAAYTPVTLKRTPGLIGAWSATGLPAGMVVTRGGVLSGTPTESGSFTVTVRFTDFVPRTSSRSLTLTIN